MTVVVLIPLTYVLETDKAIPDPPLLKNWPNLLEPLACPQTVDLPAWNRRNRGLSPANKPCLGFQLGLA
jgi:hypothetical protein